MADLLDFFGTDTATYRRPLQFEGRQWGLSGNPGHPTCRGFLVPCEDCSGKPLKNQAEWQVALTPAKWHTIAPARLLSRLRRITGRDATLDGVAFSPRLALEDLGRLTFVSPVVRVGTTAQDPWYQHFVVRTPGDAPQQAIYCLAGLLRPEHPQSLIRGA